MSPLDNKLLILLKSFSEKETNEFKKLVASPLFASRKNYVTILNEIVRINKKGDKSVWAHELYSKLYPGKKYSSQTLKNRFSELFKLAEEYLVFKNLNAKAIEKEKILLREYLEKKMFKLFDSKYNKTKKFLESLPDSEDKFRNISFLNGINLSLLNKKPKVESMYKQFYECACYSVCIFLIELFQNGVEFALQEYDNVKIESNIIVEILLSLQIEELIKSFSRSNSKIQKVVCMHYFLYKAYQNPNDEKNYFEMKKIFNEQNNFFSPEYKNDLYKSMISYCIIRQNSGVKKFQYELFDLYNEKLKQGLYSEFKATMFPINTFRDFVYIGIEIKKYKWVENFIKKYSKELPEEIREDEINLSHAKLLFYNRYFEKALQHLNKVKGTNYIHYCDSSTLKLCCYFELHRFEDSFFEIDKFRHYIRNHKEIPRVHQAPNLNFIKIYQKILNIKTQPGKKDIGFLEKEINETKSVGKREWLLEKISG